MTGQELRALPEVDCPNQESDRACCGMLYFGRRICSYPREAHLEILIRMYGKMWEDRRQSDQERVLTDELDRARRTHPWLR